MPAGIVPLGIVPTSASAFLSPACFAFSSISSQCSTAAVACTAAAPPFPKKLHARVLRSAPERVRTTDLGCHYVYRSVPKPSLPSASERVRLHIDPFRTLPKLQLSRPFGLRYEKPIENPV